MLFFNQRNSDYAFFYSNIKYLKLKFNFILSSINNKIGLINRYLKKVRNNN